MEGKGLFYSVLLVVVFVALPCAAQENGKSEYVPDGVYLHLTKEFYEAIQDRGNEKIYSNDPSVKYLKQITDQLEILTKISLEQLRLQEEILEQLKKKDPGNRN